MKDQLGHHSIKVTVDVYGHLVPGANKAAVDRLDEQARALEAAMGQGTRGRFSRAVSRSSATRRHPRATRRLSKSNAGSRVAP